MMNRAERGVLGNLSEQVFGSTSRWVKWSEQYRIEVGKVDVPHGKKYVQLDRKKDDKRPGTIISQEKAELLGYENPNKDVLVTRTLWRAATYSELLVQLLNMRDYLRFSAMENDVRQHVLAYKLAYDTAHNFPTVKLTKQEREGYEADLTGIVQVVAEAIRPKVGALLETPAESGYEMDAVDFIGDVVFCLSHPEDAEHILHEALATADSELKDRRKKSAQKSFLQSSVKIGDTAYSNTVPAKKLAKQKVQRTMAKKSKRHNRKKK